jgi:hypothetical protein
MCDLYFVSWADAPRWFKLVQLVNLIVMIAGLCFWGAVIADMVVNERPLLASLAPIINNVTEAFRSMHASTMAVWRARIERDYDYYVRLHKADQLTRALHSCVDAHEPALEEACRGLRIRIVKGGCELDEERVTSSQLATDER